jgi:hypothetical protein
MGITSWLVYLLFLVYVHYGSQFHSIATMATVFFSGKFYLAFVLVVGTCFMFDTVTYSWDSLFNNRITSTMMRLVKATSPLDNTENLPQDVKDCLNKYKVYENSDSGEKKSSTNVAPPRVEIYTENASVIAQDRMSMNEFGLLKKKKTIVPSWVETLRVDELFEVQAKLSDLK